MSLFNTRIDFYYTTENDSTIGNAQIELYDRKYSKANMLLENFENGFKAPFVCDKEVIVKNKKEAYIILKYEVPNRCKTKLKHEITEAYERASQVALNIHSKLYKNEKMSKTCIKKAYVLNDKQLENLDKIYVLTQQYKQETTYYFVKEVEELIKKLNLEEKQQQKVNRNFKKLIQRIVEAEIEGETVKGYEFNEETEVGKYVKFDDKVDYSMESIIIDDNEYKIEDIKIVFNSGNSYYINTINNKKYKIIFGYEE